MCAAVYDAAALHGMHLTQDQLANAARLSFTSHWVFDRVWLAHATRLDGTHLFYFLPDRFNALARVSARHYECVPVAVGRMTIYLMGCHPYAQQPLDQCFFDQHMAARLDTEAPALTKAAAAVLRFARALDEEMKNSKPERVAEWHRAYNKQQDYCTTHRRLAVRIGKATGRGDPSHDLSMTR